MLIYGNLTDAITFPVNFPILTGKYKDFTAEWYTTVGATICLTCFTNTIFPLTNLMYWLKLEVKRCYDRGWRCNERLTRKLL